MRHKINDFYNSDHFFVGSAIIEALSRYSAHRIETGGFLRAMLEGDLYAAAGYADINNQQRLYHIAKYIVNTLPHQSYGSKEKVATWLRRK